MSPFVQLSNVFYDRFIGFKNWSHPFAESYLGMTGGKGRFLGFWAVMMQAFFSFSGSEIAGIVSLLCFAWTLFSTNAAYVKAAGEVIDATRVSTLLRAIAHASTFSLTCYRVCPER